MSGIMVMSCAPQQKKLVYPETAKVDTVDVYFGTQVPDPYRWLENDTSAATTAWVEAQNKVPNEYLSQIPFRENLLKRLTTLADYEKISGRVFYIRILSIGITCIASSFAGEADRECCMRMKKEYGNTIKRFK